MAQASLIEGRELPVDREDASRMMVELIRHPQNFALHFERLGRAVAQDDVYGALTDLFIATEPTQAGARQRALDEYGDRLSPPQLEVLSEAVAEGLLAETPIPPCPGSIFTCGATSPAPLVVTAEALPPLAVVTEPVPPEPDPNEATVPPGPADRDVAVPAAARHRRRLALAAAGTVAAAAVVAAGLIATRGGGGGEPATAPSTSATPPSVETSSAPATTVGPAVRLAPATARAAALAGVAALEAPDSAWDASAYLAGSPAVARIEAARELLARQGARFDGSVDGVVVESQQVDGARATVALALAHGGITLVSPSGRAAAIRPGDLLAEVQLTRVDGRWLVDRVTWRSR